MVRSRRAVLVWMTLAAFASESGCASARLRPPPSLPEALRAQLGTVGVAGARFVPEAKLALPARGSAEGATRGAAGGAAATALAGLEAAASAAPAGGEAGGLAALLAIAAGLALMPVGAVVGAIAGAAKAEPAARVDEAEAALRSALAALKVQETVRDQVLATARDRAARPCVLVADRGPSAPGEAVSYASLAGEGIDTVLEVSVPAVAFTGSRAVNPPLEFRMTVEARLVRVSDGAVLHAFAPTYWSRRRRFTEWAIDGAEPFRREFDRAASGLAESVVEELFLLYVPPEPAEGRRPASG